MNSDINTEKFFPNQFKIHQSPFLLTNDMSSCCMASNRPMKQRHDLQWNCMGWADEQLFVPWLLILYLSSFLCAIYIHTNHMNSANIWKTPVKAMWEHRLTRWIYRRFCWFLREAIQGCRYWAIRCWGSAFKISLSGPWSRTWTAACWSLFGLGHFILDHQDPPDHSLI